MDTFRQAPFICSNWRSVTSKRTKQTTVQENHLYDYMQKTFRSNPGSTFLFFRGQLNQGGFVHNIHSVNHRNRRSENWSQLVGWNAAIAFEM